MKHNAREDLANSRCSRSTHPQTISKLQDFYSLVCEKEFKLLNPFINNTKADIMDYISKNSPELISSSVSCSCTNFTKGEATHCGECFQCIDRRISAFVKCLQKYDHRGLYNYDLISEPLKPTVKTIAIDYIRQAISFLNNTSDSFYQEYLYELSQIIDYIPIKADDLDKAEFLWSLFKKHGEGIRDALSIIRQEYDDVFSVIPKPETLLSIISHREYLKKDTELLADKIDIILKNGISEMFASFKPKNESDLNEKIGALLRTHHEEFRSEYPTVSFALSKVIPDHEWKSVNILIEVKYIRSNTTPSVANKGIAAAITKYPKDKYIIFVVYDPAHKIKSDKVFIKDIQSHGRNRVLIIR